MKSVSGERVREREGEERKRKVGEERESDTERNKRVKWENKKVTRGSVSKEDKE